jgi:hypothetical protein
MKESVKLEQIIRTLENYLGCWRQFSQFLALGRTKKFRGEEEQEFLEVKSLIVQQTEAVFAAMEVPSPTKDEIHTLLTTTPSLRQIADMNEGVVRTVESQWHKIYIAWHAILGQLKVQAQRPADTKNGLFGRKG